MANGEFRIAFKGQWDKAMRITNPREFERRMRLYIGVATNRNVLKSVAKIRDVIKEGQFPENQPLTIALKGSSKPLIGRTGALWQSISPSRISWNIGFAGIKRGTISGGKNYYNIGMLLHKGFKIKDLGGKNIKVRNLFKLLAAASAGTFNPGLLRGRAAELWAINKKWYPVNKNEIVVKPRRFIKSAFTKELKEDCRREWKEAMVRVLKGY
jgi:hypothetical protein